MGLPADGIADGWLVYIGVVCTVIAYGLFFNALIAFLLIAVVIFFFVIAAAFLHGIAYFGLRARKPWGWIAAVIMAAAWSLILIGIPVLVVLIRSSPRHAYGVP